MGAWLTLMAYLAYFHGLLGLLHGLVRHKVRHGVSHGLLMAYPMAYFQESKPWAQQMA